MSEQIELQIGKTYENNRGELIKIKAILSNQICVYNISEASNMWLSKERVIVKRLIR
jgi:hypothetical protein